MIQRLQLEDGQGFSPKRVKKGGLGGRLILVKVGKNSGGLVAEILGRVTITAKKAEKARSWAIGRQRDDQSDIG